MKPTSGFTLLQTLIVLAVVPILLGIAIPTYADTAASIRVAAARTAMVESILQSSRQAVVLSDHVVLCPVDNGSSCLDGTEWTSGWIAFVDTNGDRTRSPIESIVLRQPALAGPVRMHSTQGRKRIVFQPKGHAAGSNVTFTLCAGSKPRHASTLIVANSGLWRLGPPDAKSAAVCAGGS